MSTTLRVDVWFSYSQHFFYRVFFREAVAYIDRRCGVFVFFNQRLTTIPAFAKINNTFEVAFISFLGFRQNVISSSFEALEKTTETFSQKLVIQIVSFYTLGKKLKKIKNID